MARSIRAAVAQMEPIYLDTEATLRKVAEYMRKAAAKGAELVVFPELILPGYPNWVNLHDQANSDRHLHYWESYIAAALSLDSPEVRKLAETAREVELYLVCGFAERDLVIPNAIYNSALLIDPKGQVLGAHRKLSPIRQELLFFGKGGPEDVRVFPTAVGRIGIGICAEHSLALYAQSLAAMGEEIHCALWVSPPQIKHVIDAFARSLAVAGNTFVLAACQVSGDEGGARCELDFLGGSGIVSPDGNYLAGPIYGEETILLADLDFQLIRRSSTVFHAAGRDRRDDLFSFAVRRDAG